jgi:hypothetical protein
MRHPHGLPRGIIKRRLRRAGRVTLDKAPTIGKDNGGARLSASLRCRGRSPRPWPAPSPQATRQLPVLQASLPSR